MNSDDRRIPLWLLGGFFLLVAVASIRPVSNYDYFWNLATGRWIVEHQALPLTDPFGVASDRIPWINGEWLFEVALYLGYSIAGHAGIAILRVLAMGALFTTSLAIAARRSSPAPAFFLTAFCWYGAEDFLGERPAAAAAAIMLGAILLLLGKPTRWRLALYVLLSVIWVNIHPSAVLAPVLAGIVAVARFAVDPDERTGRAIRMRIGFVLFPAIALLANPHGITGLLAPFHLVQTLRTGSFVNLEWLPSSPVTFPLLYLLIVAGLGMYAFSSEKKQHLDRVLLFSAIAVLAIRFVRNQPLLYVVAPVLLAPLIPRSLFVKTGRIITVVTAIAIAALIPTRRFELGVNTESFPVHAVDQLEKTGARGNVFNADQFGGYLIWRFYPERRTLHDGRNELYGTYLAEHDRARQSSRDWSTLLEKYNVALAVDEYHREYPGGLITVIDPVTGGEVSATPSSVFFPPKAWALIGFDDVGMVFARRDRWSGTVALEEIEYTTLHPDDPRPRFESEELRAKAFEEIQRAEKETRPTRVLVRLQLAWLESSERQERMRTP